MNTLLQIQEDVKDALYTAVKSKIPKSYVGTLPKLDNELYMKGEYFPKEIQQYIISNVKWSWTCGDVIFYLFNKDDPTTTSTKRMLYKGYIFIQTALLLCRKYSRMVCKNPIIHIYLTPLLKRLGNNQILGPFEVNSGYTQQCNPTVNGRIVVYRKEEWFKVYLHESIHYFGMDFSDMNQQIYQPYLKQMFCINSKHNLFESYTEFWGEILFCCIYSELTHSDLYTIIYKETQHSISQCKKILGHMNLKYTDLLCSAGGSKHIGGKFSEKTNVFDYYILKTIYMCYLDEFLKWCSKHNESLVSFTKTESVVKSLCEWIRIHYDSREFIQLMSYSKQVNRHSKKQNDRLKMMLIS